MTEESFNKEKILARVRKMVALASDSAASEGERDNAMRMAHATLAKYNLSMAEASAHGQAPKEQRVNNVLNVRDYAWMRSVANHIAKLFFCEYFYVRNPVTKHAQYYFIGKETNARIAMEMSSSIMASIDKEGQELGMKRDGSPKGTYWRSFCKGATQRIAERCVDMIVEAMRPAGSSTGTALVLANVYQTEAEENVRYMREEMKVRVEVRKSKQHAPIADAFMSGRQFGESVNLNTNLLKG